MGPPLDPVKMCALLATSGSERSFMSCSRPRYPVAFLASFGVVIFSPLGVREARALSADVVISQVYGGGGNAGATLRNDFIELFNRGASPISLSGWSVQYASSAGSTWAVTNLSGTLQPGQYFLVQEAVGAGGTQDLPPPDATGTIAMSATTGKVLLASSTTASSGACPSGGAIVDLVGFGGASCSEGSPTPALTNTTAAIRNLAGCTEADSNQTDFTTGAPTPRNSSSPFQSCGEAAPAVTTTSPAKGDLNVSTGSTISVTFSEPVNVNAGAISVECPAGTVVASNTGALTNVSGALLSPPSPLPGGIACQIKVSAAGVSDVDAVDPPDHPLSDFSAGFTTAGAGSCAAIDTPIGQIQGSGSSAALTGTQTVQGVVVADFEYPGSGAAGDYLRGFYLQNTPDTSDGDPLTSDAIFVFNPIANTVSLGQVVQVTGTVTEFAFGSVGGTLTEITSPTIQVCGTTDGITPVNVSLPLASPDDLERYEGMLVTFPQSLFVTEHFQLERFGQVELSGSQRLPQPTNVAAPGAPAAAQQALNDLNRILLDDELQNQDPDPIRFGRNGTGLTAANTLRGGDAVQGLTGVLTQSDATTASNVPSDSDPVLYRVRPFNVLNAATPNFQASNARPSVPPALPGSLKIAGFNLLNYFNTFGTTACTFGVGGGVAECRGADNATEFSRQSQKTVRAALGTGADILVVSELENDGYGATSAIADLTNQLNAASAPGTWAFIDADARTGQVNALGVDAIKVAMLYQPARVTPVGQTAVANTGAFGLYTVSSGPPIQRSRPALAQAFQETTGAHGRVVVVGNHLKSKGSGCDDNVSPVGPDPDENDGQGNCNLTRTAAAQQLVTWLAGNPTATGETRILILGDLNAYAEEDPVVALQNGGYTNLISSRIGVDAYSYVFDGQWGYLDHALASSSLVGQVGGIVEWHINADEPNALDYNTDFKSAGQVASLYAADPFRASDHDPVVVGLNLTAAASVPAVGGSPRWAMALLLLGCGLWLSGRALRRAPRRA
jgi:predicted extracellular nuclease